jgi:hypothetical protein
MDGRDLIVGVVFWQLSISAVSSVKEMVHDSLLSDWIAMGSNVDDSVRVCMYCNPTIGMKNPIYITVLRCHVAGCSE